MERAKDILPRLFQKVPGWKGLELDLIRSYWPQVVGPLLASNCVPREIKRARLAVEVADASWMEEFWPMRGQVLALLQHELPSVRVESINAYVAPPAGDAEKGALSR